LGDTVIDGDMNELGCQVKHFDLISEPVSHSTPNEQKVIHLPTLYALQLTFLQVRS
jgi:hypothetical protein